MGGWVSTTPNVVRICKSVRIIGHSLRHFEIFVSHGLPGYFTSSITAFMPRSNSTTCLQNLERTQSSGGISRRPDGSAIFGTVTY